MSQTPIYDQLRGERIDVDVLASGGADPQRVGHTRQHRLPASPLSAAAVSGRPAGPGADLAENNVPPRVDIPGGSASRRRTTGCTEGRSASTSSPRAISAIAVFREPMYVRLELSIMSKILPTSSSEAAPRTAKSVGTPHGPCGFLSASSRRDSRSGVADRRHPLRRTGRPKPQSPSLCHPSWLVRRSKRLCGNGQEEHYALLETWLKCQSLRVQGALGGLRPVLSSSRTR